MIRIASVVFLCGCADLIGITDERSLEVVSLGVSKGTLDPPFDPAITDYRVELPFGATLVEVHAEASSPAATIEIGGVASATQAIALPVGETVVEVVARTSSDVRATYRVRVTRADLAIGFSGPRAIPTTLPGMIERVGVADFDGNGTDDVGAVSGAGDLVLMFNTGAATFTQHPTMYGGTRTFAVRDLDGDSRSDLVFVTNGQLSVARGFGNGSFEPPTFYGGNQGLGFALLQLDPDGRPDLVLAEQLGRLAVFQGQPAPGLGFYPQPALDQQLGNPLTMLVAGRIDTLPGDDVASLDFVAGKIYVHGNTGTGLGLAPLDLGPGAEPVELTAADLDGDERLELVWLDRADDAVVVQSFPGPPRATYPLPGHPRSLVAADVDGDGKRDVLVLDDQGVTVLHNGGDGTLAAKSVPLAMAGTPRIAVGDFNGDGRADLATSNFTSTFHVYLGMP